ncbi:hypothetical protein Ait01nite_095520 [Actinoplanes italicus]|uniref:Lipoprotein n=1 Tax=Actinoplanes italicus TaxID=113567 RepID=A0A2T0JMP0_9ACTN|nr:hypothetical protein [Actinoplanes italicus]PRX08880.1 hypothetical protein CLV67_13812 [Actinoplanes italicus]GIE36507.1 hypothetical protein Ait01nite_095520 [Actinoplanes italicus]
MIRARHLLAGAAAAALLLTLVSCGGGSQAAPEPQLRLRATAEQWRQDEVARQLGIALHNDGDRPVWISRVEPDLPSFEGEAPADTQALLPPNGLRVDVTVPYGTGGCVAAAEASYVTVVARVEGETRTQRVRLALPHPNELLNRLLADDCAAETVRRTVTFRFGDWTDLGADGVRGSLVVERTAAATAARAQLHTFDGNVMYRLAYQRATPLAEVTAAAPVATLPFVASPLRCDLHAFAEVKKPFEFPVRVSLDGGKQLYTTVPVDEDDKKALDTMLRRNCGVPPAGS